MGEKDFPLEKILTVSARDYVESRPNYMYDYEFVGVHSNSREGIIDFAQQVPNNAEVVVDYRAFITGITGFESGFSLYIMSGTALIPKDKRES